MENLAVAEDGYGRRPFDADELRVPVTDAAAVGRSMGEPINDARSRRVLLNNKSVRLSPTWHVKCRCFVYQTSKLI